jgi:hypothetical protein
MPTRTVRSGAALVLSAGLLAGCESTPQRTPYADNPLLQARQPLLQPAGAPASDPTQVAQAGPKTVVVPPPGLYQQPPAGFAAAPPNPTYPAPTPTYPGTGPALPPAIPTSASRVMPEPTLGQMAPPAPLPLPAAAVVPLPTATPAAVAPTVAPAVAVVPAPAAPPPVTQAAVRTAEGKFGHSADYTWLQGELDRHYRGHLELRYRPMSEDDPYGGKVRLEDDPLLAQFRPGDVIAVEGEMLTDPDGASAAPWAQYKRFHIRAARLVERK